MDADSSSKFIGSLTKFLQSLCNGYVDFEDGVELIGHIYLSVDTGKKIDYILNEKVCKSDNSVTFISNSFHAQPADKLKTAVGKKSSEDKSDGGSRKDEDIIMSESGDSLPRTSNVGPTPGRPVGSLRPGITAQNRSLKRPGSPLTSRKASSPPQRRPLTPPTQRRSQLQVSKVSLGSPASSKNVPSSPSSSSQDNIPSPSSRVKTRNDSISAVQTVQLSGDLGDLDKDNQAQGNMLPVVQVPDLSSFLGSATNEGQDVSQEHALATPDDTKPDTDITFIKEEFIPGASSCAQAGSSGQPSGRSMEEQLQDSGSPSGLYPVMLHQNTAAFSNAGSVFPGSFSQLGNATTTPSRVGYNQPVPSTSASQGAADIFSNPVPGTSQDSSGGDPAAEARFQTHAHPTLSRGLKADLSAGCASPQTSDLDLRLRVSDELWSADCAVSELASEYSQPLLAAGSEILGEGGLRPFCDGWSAETTTTTSSSTTRWRSLVSTERTPARGSGVACAGELDGAADLSPDKPHGCRKCGRRYAQLCSLSRHRKECEGRPGLACIFCEHVFHRKDRYRVHLLCKHQYVDKELGPPGYTLASKQ